MSFFDGGGGLWAEEPVSDVARGGGPTDATWQRHVNGTGPEAIAVAALSTTSASMVGAVCVGQKTEVRAGIRAIEFC